MLDSKEGRRIVARRNGARRRINLALGTVEELETLLGITERWTEETQAYRDTLEYISNHEFIRAVSELEGLVVQRLFELAKCNLAGTSKSASNHV